MVFALEGLSLLLNEEFQVLLVVQNLLDVLLDRADEKLVLFVSLLHAGVLLLKRTNTLFDLGQLAIGLLKKLLKFKIV